MNKENRVIEFEWLNQDEGIVKIELKDGTILNGLVEVKEK